MDFTVKICRQTLKPKKGNYVYTAEEPDFKELTTQELNKLYLDAQAIMAQVQVMLERRQ